MQRDLVSLPLSPAVRVKLVSAGFQTAEELEGETSSSAKVTTPDSKLRHAGRRRCLLHLCSVFRLKHYLGQSLLPSPAAFTARNGASISLKSDLNVVRTVVLEIFTNCFLYQRLLKVPRNLSFTLEKNPFNVVYYIQYVWERN